ncbi:MAG: putative porin, partial [Bacteroidales bacterium]|nr:putative porin [Bacteroidales bacterium]
MKSFVSIVFIFLIAFVSTVFAQHEGIERHFNEYSIEEHIFENDFYSADTLTDNFHQFYSEYPFYFSTGNMALPAHPAFFADFKQTHDFIFYEGYTNFVYDLDNAKFFDARKPFTRIKYVGGVKKLDDISFVHTQNVKPWFNIGAEYRSVNSEGHYANQQLKAHAAHLFSDYRKNRYWGHFDLVYNKINHQENGGIESDSIFRLNVQRPANLGVNLHTATVRLGNIGARYRHNIKLGAGYNDTIIVEKDSLPIKRYPSRFSIGQDLSFNKYHRVYDDIPSSFYQNIFLDSVATHDSLGVLMFNHGLYLQYNLAGLNNKFPNAIIRLEFLNEIKLYSIGAFVHDPFVRLSTYGLENKHDWRFAFAYCFADVHLGEFYLDADYK